MDGERDARIHIFFNIIFFNTIVDVVSLEKRSTTVDEMSKVRRDQN